MVDRYYRKIENVENEIENSIQISGILLKLKEHDDLSNNNKNKLEEIENHIFSESKNISLSLNDVINDVDVVKNDLDNIKNNIDVVNLDLNNVKDDLNNLKNNIDVVNLDLNNVKFDVNNLNNYYKLKDIYTFDIKSKSQFVDKNKPFHIFEQSIINNFKKDSYLDVSIKVLTEISNYILIGFFEILCEFYNENNDLFYDISLSTAMGSINKLSTVKSVFIVPINKDMTKIKIDFYIRPKLSQQSRSATYNIIDINSNKIYIKYFQK